MEQYRLGVLLMLLFVPSLIAAGREVILSCGDETNNNGVSDIVLHGPRGEKGEPGECGPWESALRRLEVKIERLQEQLDRAPKIHHFVISNRLTWGSAKLFCERMHLIMCSYSDIFPFNDNIPFPIGVKEGDHWAPIRDAVNDWAEVGNDIGRNGYRHNHYYSPPPWGVSTDPSSYKGDVFCCVPEVGGNS